MATVLVLGSNRSAWEVPERTLAALVTVDLGSWWRRREGIRRLMRYGLPPSSWHPKDGSGHAIQVCDSVERIRSALRQAPPALSSYGVMQE